MPVYILGISAFYHDSAACLLRDGEVLAAAQEERFTRLKNDARFPAAAIRFCLEFAGIKLREVSYVAFYEKPFLKFERLVETYVAFAPHGMRSFWKAMPGWLKEKLFQKQMLIRALRQLDPEWRYATGKLLFTEHHQAHAASAFYPSPFAEAVVLTVDGVGEWTTTSVSHGAGHTMTPLREIRFPHSLGLLYSAFTYYLGFKVNSDEYKVMGLAPYGQPTYVATIYEHLLDLKADGSFRLNLAYFDYCTGLTMTNGRFDALFGQPARRPAEALTAVHLDLARSIQQVTEEVMLRLTRQLHQEFGLDNLCLAGGVALNCVANGRVLRESGFRQLWIQPAAGDAGGALGAALAVHHEHLGQARAVATPAPDQLKNALLGPAYPRPAVRAALWRAGLVFEELEDAAFPQAVAGHIAAGNVVGFFQGRMEFGPRALGSRSILGDARNAAMQSVMNLKIKFRESFRPFAPAVLEESAADYFELTAPSPYMLLVAAVRPKHRLPLLAEAPAPGLAMLKQIRSSIPAATHVDYSARIQTVNARDNPGFYPVLRAFYQLTGVPVILNTSFNVNDEPIVCSPADAIACFQKSGLDVLAIENCLVVKQPLPPP